jgi:ribosomal protein L11 methyltransferase
VDTDPVAQTVTRSNITLNAVTDQIEFRLGTLNDVLTPEERNPNRAFNLIVANLFSDILIQLLEDGLAALLIPNGLFILSGILARQSAEVETALAQAGFALLDKQTSDDDWVALVAQRQ